MNEQELLNIVYAYSTGSLDPEDMPAFSEFKKSGSLRMTELGELQNVISLLPVILEIEKPNAKLKDKVARRLYRMQSEILANSGQNKIPPMPPPVNTNIIRENNYYDEPLRIEVNKPFINEEEVERYKNEEAEREPLLNESLFSELKEQEAKTYTAPYNARQPQINEEFSKPASVNNRDQESLNNYPQFLNDEDAAPSGKTSKLVIVLITILFVLTAVIAAGIYLYFSGELKKSNVQITSLNEQIKTMDDEIVRLNKSQRVLSIISSKDAKTINLDGTISNPNGFGKLILDTQGNEGLLQLYRMPLLKSGQVYQLWLISKGQTFSLGNYKPQKEVEYLPITQFPDVLPGDIDSFKVTIEEGEGSDIPKGDVYLATTVKPGLLK